MSVDIVSIPSAGFGVDEHECFCLNDLKDQDVVGHDVTDNRGGHSLSHFRHRECAKIWVKTKIQESRNLEAARCPTCLKTINAASILSQQEIDECIPNALQNRLARRTIINRIFCATPNEPAGAGFGIGAGMGSIGAVVALAAGVGVALSSEPIGFGLAFVGALASEIGVGYASMVAKDFVSREYQMLLVPALCTAVGSGAGSVIGAIGGAPLLTSAVVGAVAPFAVVAVSMAGATVGACVGFLKG